MTKRIYTGNGSCNHVPDLYESEDSLFRDWIMKYCYLCRMCHRPVLVLVFINQYSYLYSLILQVLVLVLVNPVLAPDLVRTTAQFSYIKWNWVQPLYIMDSFYQGRIAPLFRSWMPDHIIDGAYDTSAHGYGSIEGPLRVAKKSYPDNWRVGAYVIRMA